MTDNPSTDGNETAAAAPASMSGPITLALDIGGSGLKAGLLDAAGQLIGQSLRIVTPHPSPPAVVVPALSGMANSLGKFERASVGFPGVVREGKVLTAPNLGTKDWAGYDLAGTLEELLGVPVRAENDATVQGLGVISGHGLECVITLGTGFGFALYKDGRLAPHLEVSQHIAFGKKNYDEYVGVKALEKIGPKRWNKRVKFILKQLRLMINFDTIYIGGGDAMKINFALPPDTRLVSNKAGLTGGVQLWSEANLP